MRLKKLFTQFLFIIFTIVISSAVFASGDGDIAVVPGAKPISINEAEKLLGAPNVYFFDANVEEVRNQNGYIDGATLIDEMDWEKSLPEDKNATIVFYCLNRLCTASSEIALQAQKLGYNNVYVMLDGIEGWITSGRVARKISEARWLSGSEVKDYKDGIHKELIFGELPACRDCHGTDGIKVAVANSKDTINTNCADCHKDVKEVFFKSVHGEKKDTGMPAGTLLFDNSDKPQHGDASGKMGNMEKEKPKEQPICWDCHNVHATEKSAVFSMEMVSDEKCGSCHEKEQKRYYTTFHGKAMYLNSVNSAPTVAACYSCHGIHNIYKVDDNRSTLAPANRVETCKKCHEDSNEKFAGFIAHADHTDKKNYPMLWYAYVFMTGLIVIVFAFFGLHTFIWSLRLFAMRLRHPEAWKKARHAAHADDVAIRRFQLFHRVQHFFMAASFLTLSFSGLPQKFYTASWAQSMIEFMGGPITATKIHHVSAIVMIIVFLSHIAEVCIRAWNRRDVIRDPQTGKMKMMLFLKGLFGPDSLMPRWQDFKDLANHVKWFFNKGERPQFDRWTYWEKFDYLAVFWGMFIIGFSGLILWFPTFFSILLPGWMINLATLVHSDEALLATGFIFAVHFFNTHFRADRFPMDMVIFSGTITREEMLQERVVWYERLVKEGNLDKLSEENGKYNSYKWVARVLGIGMLLTGLIFLFLIIFALVTS